MQIPSVGDYLKLHSPYCPQYTGGRVLQVNPFFMEIEINKVVRLTWDLGYDDYTISNFIKYAEGIQSNLY